MPPKKVRLDVDEKGIKISVNKANSTSRTVPCKSFSGAKMACGFNAKYITECLSKINEDFIRVQFSPANRPASVKPIDSEKYNFVLFPYKLN